MSTNTVNADGDYQTAVLAPFVSENVKTAQLAFAQPVPSQNFTS